MALKDLHEYRAQLRWTGNPGDGIVDYASYGRSYAVTISGKPAIAGSADPAFRGDANLHNPEDHFLAAIAGCHMLAYLALCARREVCVLSYEDTVHGVLRLRRDGGGAFERVTLSPSVVVATEQQVALGVALHDAAAEQCFIANSCRTPIAHRPTVRAATPPAASEDPHARR